MGTLHLMIRGAQLRKTAFATLLILSALVALALVFRVPIANFAYARGSIARNNPNATSPADRWFRIATFLHPRFESAWQAWGDMHEERHNLEQAERIYTSYTRKNPNSANAYSGLGWVVYRRLDYPKALELQDRATGLARNDRDQARAYSRKGHVLYSLERYQEAAAAFEKALELLPESENIPLYLSAVYEKMGDRQKLETLAKEFSTDRMKADAAVHDAVSSVETWERGGKTKDAASKDALASLDVALRLFPQDPWVKIAQGTVYFRLGNYEKAIASFQSVLVLEPRNTTALNNLAAVYNQVGEYEEAAEAVSKALQQSPRILIPAEYPRNSWRHLGDAYSGLYRKTGDQNTKDVAVRAYEKALSYDATYEPAKRGLEELQ